MVDILVGGQFGSEGKGLIAGHIAQRYDAHVRVGAANAGHTFYVEGEKFVVQQVPCAAYASPHATLVLGAGAMITPHILLEEIERNAEWRESKGLPQAKLVIDPKAHVIQNYQVELEQQSRLGARIGSTSTIAREGIGAAQAEKVWRSAECVQVRDDIELLSKLDKWTYLTCEDRYPAATCIREHDRILLEGTQGTGLSLTHGFFPYTTSRETTASGLAAECGVGPKYIGEVIVVFRTFPIRVAGNSGPFYPDSEELTFKDIGVEEERTTVTKLTRRIATFSYEQLKDAVTLNAATQLAITFADYLEPEIAGREGDLSQFSGSFLEDEGRLADFIGSVARATRFHVPITFIGTGPHSVIEGRGSGF